MTKLEDTKYHVMLFHWYKNKYIIGYKITTPYVTTSAQAFFYYDAFTLEQKECTGVQLTLLKDCGEYNYSELNLRKIVQDNIELFL